MSQTIKGMENSVSVSVVGILEYLRLNYDPTAIGLGEEETPPPTPTATAWSFADLFIRQYLNNMVDGFGLKNVEDVYDYLVKNKDVLIKFNLVSKKAWNNSGFPLWEDYDFHNSGACALLRYL